MEEEWRDIEGFPGYAVSQLGRVLNDHFSRIMNVLVNQQGIPNVGLVYEGRQYKRSLAPIVARHFLPPPRRESFNCAINLNGDRLDCRADNLAWRPRWFAVKYHSQFKRPERPYRARVGCFETGEEFDRLREAAVAYGILENEIILSIDNKTPVFPTWHSFYVAD